MPTTQPTACRPEFRTRVQEVATVPRSTPHVYLASPVFRAIADHPKVSMRLKYQLNTAWSRLKEVARVSVAEERFPSPEALTRALVDGGVDFLGCHLGHAVSAEATAVPTLKAVATSNVGYDHIALSPDVLVTNAPGVMGGTIADYTISLILANLRNIVALNAYVWDGQWSGAQRWDLDSHLTKTTENLTLGIIGLGEIGREVARRLAPWGIHIGYHDLGPVPEFEQSYPNVNYYEDLEQLFAIADVVSLHLPLNESTHHLVGERLLRRMKYRALLVNTARGAIIDLACLARLLRAKEIELHLALDVFEAEPISPELLADFREIARLRPDLRFIFTPHSASADADTRAGMAATMLTNLHRLAASKGPGDLELLNLIPPQRTALREDPAWLCASRIHHWWAAGG
jgi:glyoxylate reductase